MRENLFEYGDFFAANSRDAKNIKRVAALGFFDGVHLGHQALMKTANFRAEQLNAQSCAITFDVHPLSAVTKKEFDILNPDLRLRTKLLIEHGGVDEVIVIKFDDKIMNMPFEKFFTDMLIKRYNVCHVVMGESYTCGRDGLGTPENIVPLCRKLRLGYDVIETVKSSDGKTVSSTRIREYISCGDIKNAEHLLGYEWKK